MTEHPPYADEGVVPGPVEHLDSHPADTATTTDPLPLVLPPRRRGRTVVAGTLAVLLVLVAGGAAYGWSVLQRPEVQLARAFDATRSAAQGTLTVSVTGAGKGATASLAGASLRYAWSPGTQQVLVVKDGTTVGTVTTTDTHLTLQIDPSVLPKDGDPSGALGALGGLGGTGGLAGLGALGVLGGAGDVIAALLDGKPVGIAIGPGSALQKALDKARAANGTSTAPELSPAQAARVADAVTRAVRDNATVTEAGTDANGTHYVATLPLTKVVDTAWKDVEALLPAGAASVKPGLSSLEKVTLSVDVWVQGGAVTRVEVPLGAVSGEVTSTSSQAKLVVVMSGDGVAPVAGPVTEVPESLIEMLTGTG